MSWLNIRSSNAVMGKSIGILMGLRCKQRLEYSSDRYEKSLLKPKNLVVSWVSFQAYTVSIVLIYILALSRYQRVEVLEKQGKD